ncbi:uncharacterized protein BDR25DRAFT_328613 [Lindgomyces ingoldianus]|uniref:Uncharacterized protein n=1 Tax=Lindgomyces ingoldianus TaxID=673940 RepID=A0ACB6QHK5_9PLEO|nr:uncharacterized protein BDR25DRAFT_328613 [Lindgomyces ingoldianus]KAF2465592.1 hypothetical protein BDR25DRAFT_328613 [Lindgomyces ingoldianus]
MLYLVLPAVVQTRIPTLPSIRRSISDLRGRSIHIKSLSISTEVSAPESPPPRYSSRAGRETPNRDSIVSSDTEEIDFRDDVSERPESLSFIPPPFPLSETETGINWKYSNQGISLLTQAYQESNALARGAADASAVLARQLYLHGMTYLLRGIPADLTPEETLSLQAAIPVGILDLQNDPNAHALIPFPQQGSVSQEGPVQNPSLLHRLTASIVFQTFVLIQFLLPYIRLFIGHAYRWERENKVTQRLFSKSITTVDELGRRSLQLSQTVCRMNDGKVGQAINDLTIWWVRGLTGGIQQGLSEGVVILGPERNQTSKGRVERID